MKDVDESLFFARCSLVLFLAAPLARLNIPSLDDGFCLIAEIVALICGIVGKRHLSGKVGMIGAVVIGLLALLVTPMGSPQIMPSTPTDEEENVSDSPAPNLSAPTASRKSTSD